MERPLILWAKALLRLGLVLLAIGILPALLVQYVFTDFDALIPAMLLVSVAPIGGLSLAVAVILFLVALVRRRPGEPS
jgi:polyferredoxin